MHGKSRLEPSKCRKQPSKVVNQLSAAKGKELGATSALVTGPSRLNHDYEAEAEDEWSCARQNGRPSLSSD